MTSKFVGLLRLASEFRAHPGSTLWGLTAPLMAMYFIAAGIHRYGWLMLAAVPLAFLAFEVLLRYVDWRVERDFKKKEP